MVSVLYNMPQQPENNTACCYTVVHISLNVSRLTNYFTDNWQTDSLKGLFKYECRSPELQTACKHLWAEELLDCKTAAESGHQSLPAARTPSNHTGVCWSEGLLWRVDVDCDICCCCSVTGVMFLHCNTLTVIVLSAICNRGTDTASETGRGQFDDRRYSKEDYGFRHDKTQLARTEEGRTRTDKPKTAQRFSLLALWIEDLFRPNQMWLWKFVYVSLEYVWLYFKEGK